MASLNDFQDAADNLFSCMHVVHCTDTNNYNLKQLNNNEQ